MSLEDINTPGYLTSNIHSYMFSSMKTTTLAERLQSAMDARGYTQVSLAEAAGVSQPSIWKIVTGKTQSSKKLVEIATALRVRPEWLLNGHGEMDYQPKGSDYAHDKSDRDQPIREHGDSHKFVMLWDENGQTPNAMLVPENIDVTHAKAFKLQHPSGFGEIPQGSLIVVDTKEKPGNEDYVFVELNGRQSVYKFISKGTTGYLDSGDNRIPLLSISEDTKIIGVIVFLSRFFRK